MRPQTSRQALRSHHRPRRHPNFSKRNAPSFIFSSNEPVPPNASRHPRAATFNRNNSPNQHSVISLGRNFKNEIETDYDKGFQNKTAVAEYQDAPQQSYLCGAYVLHAGAGAVDCTPRESGGAARKVTPGPGNLSDSSLAS